MIKDNNYVEVNGKKVPIENERNLLELIRKTNINIPTFCYHSKLSVYGACRMCVVDIDGRGIQTSCSTKPEPGMKVKTHTEEVRQIRKIALELLLASHDQSCPTCERSDDCKLRTLSSQLGIKQNRFQKIEELAPLDESSDALVRDPNKCVLCGDCVRVCSEIQGIGAIDFAYRGSDSTVLPAFGKGLGEVECVNCGQCAAVCPTGAITPKSEVKPVWKALGDSEKTVVVQIAPAVRIALGEAFNMPAGTITTGKLIAALKLLGFDKVFDTSFSADLTVIEEANEFIARKTAGDKLPIFTSCCPAWVKYAEQYYPELLNNLSSCKSPQQMFGSIAKNTFAKQMNIQTENMVVVSIMPCTAKKYENRRPEFSKDGIREVDFVLTTQEIAKMIKEAGIQFEELQPESMDLPLGFATGAGVIFGNSGGVSEAVLRYSYEKLTGRSLQNVDFHEVRGSEGLHEARIDIDGTEIKMAIVHGLKNAGELAKRVKDKTAEYDIIEVMSCPGGCIGGAGQPVPKAFDTLEKRTQGIYNADKLMNLHKPQDNPFLQKLYEDVLKTPNSKIAHDLLHTHYETKKRNYDDGIGLVGNSEKAKVKVKVCVGTNCYLKGSQQILHNLIEELNTKDLLNQVAVEATFCMENCENGPSISVNDQKIDKPNLESLIHTINKSLL